VNENRWQALNIWFALRPARERLILLFATILILGYLWVILGLDVLEAEASAQLKEKRSVQQENVVLDQLRSSLQGTAAEEPNLELKRTIERLEKQNERLDLEVDALSVKLVQPSQMATVLSRVMDDEAELELVSMQNRPAQQLFFRAVETGEPLKVYKHGLQLTLKGPYLASAKYLAKIEALGVRFFWEMVHYQVDEYPAGLLTIEVFTLSTQEQLINV